MIKVERITEPKLIASILGMDDPGLQEGVLDVLHCTKTEWTQYLENSIKFNDGDFMRMFAVVENEKITGYMVASNCINPPASNFFVINYQVFLGKKDDDGTPYAIAALEEVKKWALENNCHKIVTVLRSEGMARLIGRYGFKKEPEIIMSMEF